MPTTASTPARADVSLGPRSATLLRRSIRWALAFLCAALVACGPAKPADLNSDWFSATLCALFECRRPPTLDKPAVISRLTTEVHVSIAGRDLRMPWVAMSVLGASTGGGGTASRVPCSSMASAFAERYRLCTTTLEKLTAAWKATQRPVSVANLNLEFEDYDYVILEVDTSFRVPELCDAFSQHWARDACKRPDRKTSLFYRSLGRVKLFDMRELEAVDRVYEGWLARLIRENRDVFASQPIRLCSRDYVQPKGSADPCVAAFLLNGSLLAFSHVSRTKPSDTEISRFAAAFKEFLTPALGPMEDYESIKRMY